MPSHKLAQLLLRKAAQDEYVVLKLIEHPESPDEIIGFHAQQSIEKLFKAVLAARGIRFRKTHDLLELIDLLVDNGVAFPDELEQARFLTPFATDFRYEEFFQGSIDSFDRHSALRCIENVRCWAESNLRDKPPD